MKRALLALVGCAHPSAPPAQRFAPDGITYRFADPDRKAKLAAGLATLDAAIADEMAKRKLPGLAIGVVIDGELAYAKGFGGIAPGNAEAPTADTVYRIGSLSKSFTALALLQLRDDGALHLDDALATWFPPAAQIRYPAHDARPITLRQLATHTSGLPRDAGNHANPTEDDLARQLAEVRLESLPGARFSYSNTGFGLLGVAVAHAAHAPFRAVIQHRIFDPLGMSATTFDRPKAMAPAIFEGKIYDKQEVLGVEEGAGGIYSTVRDMAKYVALELSAYPPRDAPESPIVRRATLREAHDTGMFVGFSAQRASTYGFGWAHSRTCDDDDLIEHSGHVDTFQSTIELATARGVGVVALSNFGDPGGVADRVLAELAKAGGMQPRVASFQPVPALDPAMAKFLAVYNRGAGLETVLSRPIEPSEPAELAGYKALHGTCSGYKLVEVTAPTRARFALTCERGQFEVTLSVDDKGVKGFDGTSTGVAPDDVTRAATDAAGLIGAWDEAAYQRWFANPEQLRSVYEPGAANLRKTLGNCTVGAISHEGTAWKLALTCASGPMVGAMQFVDGKITRLRIDPPPRVRHCD